MAIVQRRLMQVTRALDTLSGVHLAAGVFDAAHMAMAMAVGRWPLAVGRWPSTRTPCFRALSGHLPIVVIQAKH